MGARKGDRNSGRDPARRGGRRYRHPGAAHHTGASGGASAGGRGSQPLAKFPTAPPARAHPAAGSRRVVCRFGAGQVDGPGLPSPHFQAEP